MNPLRAVSLCCLLVFSAATFAQKPLAKRIRAISIHIEVQDAQGNHIAGTEAPASSAEFTFDRIYQPGDRIVVSGPKHLAVKLDDTMPDCQLYLPNPSTKKLVYAIPYGRKEQETGSAFAPDTFSASSHHVSARVLDKQELAIYRNLALNPCDFRTMDQPPPEVFPHATTNSASRDAFDFEARNAIDGVSKNGHHGVWPYQSWGPVLRTDLWWQVDFGRVVELDKVRLMVRADFPHDSYWKSAVIEFSDGTQEPVQLEASADFQDFSFPKRKTSSIRLTHLVAANPGRWCSFIEVEAWGHDLP